MTTPAARADDEGAIREVIALYGMLLDDRRVEEWLDLFAPDAEFSQCKGHEQIADAIVGGQASLGNKHLACASIVRVDGDAALAWTDGLGMVDAGDTGSGPGYTLYPLRYYDRLRRMDGRWKFIRRDVQLPGQPLPTGAVAVPGRAGE